MAVDERTTEAGHGRGGTTSARSRFARRRRRGRLGRWRTAALALLAGALVGGSAWVVWGSGLLAVHEVHVEGARMLSEDEVQGAAAVVLGTPLARVDLAAVDERVETLVPVAAAEVHREWPGAVRIVVSEREAVAVLAEGGAFRALDDEGVLFRDYRRPPPALPVVRADDLPAATERGAASSVRDDALREVAAVVESLDRSMAWRVDHVEVGSLDAIVLVLRDGATVRWGSAEGSDLKAEVLTALMRVPATTYDVSVPQLPTTSD